MKELLIKINDEDITELMKVYNTGDENEAVRMAINEAIKKQVYSRILTLKGNVSWEGNLDELRESRI